MESPVRASGTTEGRLLVTDARLRMVLRVDPVSLQPDQAMRTSGEPGAVALLGQRIFVGNAARQTVDVYDAQGGGSAGNFGNGAVGYPTDIAVDASRRLVFVVDGQGQSVKVFTTHGTLVQVIGGPGAGGNQLLVPIGIAVDTARQQILVSDYGAPPSTKASVKIFAYDGSVVDVISGAGRCGMLGCSGGFSRPQGVALSRLDKVFVVDALLGQVLVFDRGTKTLERSIGSPSVLYVPSDVVIDANDDVFVVSNGTMSIVRFAKAAAQ